MMHYYRFHIKDYHAATAHLSNEEDLCYRRLLDMYYETERPIPLDTDWVSRRLRIGTGLVLNVLRDFFFEREDGWYSVRCNDEIDSYHNRADTARENGKSGGRPKKTQSVTDGNRIGTQSKPKETQAKANQEPITNNQEPIISPDKPVTKKGSVVSPDFTPNEASIQRASVLGVDWKAELPKFIDHHTNKGTIGKDWNAGFRTWLANSVKFGTAEPIQQSSKLSLAVCACCGSPASRKELNAWYCSKHDRYSEKVSA